MKEQKINDLKQKIDYKWRIQSVSDNKPIATCVAYIDARDVMNLLDDIVGVASWKDEYKQVENKIICGLSVKFDDEWVTKWDTGTESNIEAEKGQFSDAFKRAAVKWGVGRFLYDLDIKYVNTNKPGKGSYPVDENGKRVWDLTEYINDGGSYSKPKAQKTKKSKSTTKKDSKRPPKPTDWKLHCDKHDVDMELKFSEKKNKWYQYHYDDDNGICFGSGYKGEAK